MRKYDFMLLIGLLVSLTACGAKTEDTTDLSGSEKLSEEKEITEIIEENLLPDISEGQDREQPEEESDPALEDNILKEIVSEEETSEESASRLEVTEPEEPRTLYYMMENPGWEYYLAESILSEEDTDLELEQLTEEANEITDTEEWFVRNGLEQVSWNGMEDDTYRYEITGDDGYSGYLLDMYRIDTGEHLQCLDFSAYRYAEDFEEKDRDYVEQRIWWAQSVDDILYVAIGHNTYAESSPHTGYLIAVNLNDMSILWKSEPCTTNAGTFEIIDNTIISGYGFTSEPDNLILVNRLNGTQIEKIPIKSKADYIIRKDDVLYVRTYNTDYTFRIKRMAN